MTTLVGKLQEDALDSRQRVSDLLRRALVVATKLGAQEFVDWIGREQQGYMGLDSVPEYRRIRGTLAGVNPYRGIVPAYMDDPKEAELLSKRGVGVAVAEIEALLTDGSPESTLVMHYDKETEAGLMRSGTFGIRPVLLVERSSLAGILDTVRTTVLNWALRLEQDGILGTETSFTSAERKTASVVTYNVSHFHGPVSNTQVQQGTADSAQTLVVGTLDLSEVASIAERLRDALEELEIQGDRLSEFETDLATVEQQLASPNPKRPILREALRSIRTILETAAGGALAIQLVAVLDKMPL